MQESLSQLHIQFDSIQKEQLFLFPVVLKGYILALFLSFGAENGDATTLAPPILTAISPFIFRLLLNIQKTFSDVLQTDVLSDIEAFIRISHTLPSLPNLIVLNLPPDASPNAIFARSLSALCRTVGSVYYSPERTRAIILVRPDVTIDADLVAYHTIATLKWQLPSLCGDYDFNIRTATPSQHDDLDNFIRSLV